MQVFTLDICSVLFCEISFICENLLLREIEQFQLRFGSNHTCFGFPSHCDWSRKLTPPPQPIRCKTETNRDFVARVSSDLAPFNWSSHWLMIMSTFYPVGCCHYFCFSKLSWNCSVSKMQKIWNHVCFFATQLINLLYYSTDRFDINVSFVFALLWVKPMNRF